MNKLFYYLVILCIILCYSCKQQGTTGIKVENFSTGKAGEMILSIDTAYWTKEAREEIYGVLQQPQPAINQYQEMFDVIECSNSGFLASFTRHRNILQFDYNKNYGSNHFELKRNPYTNPQIQAVIRGNNCDSCMAIFRKHKDEIIQAMYDNDIARLQNAHRKLNNPAVEKKIKEKFGITMTIPENYFIGREEEDFLWLCFRTPKNDRFVMIYKSPLYELTSKNIVADRNRVTKAYIQGAVQGAYPIVADIEGFPISKPLKLRYHEGMELRGLWSSVRDKMGGPFYSYTTLSADRETCITIDGFVYAPQEQKRDYLREVEAIVKSIR